MNKKPQEAGKLHPRALSPRALSPRNSQNLAGGHLGHDETVRLDVALLLMVSEGSALPAATRSPRAEGPGVLIAGEPSCCQGPCRPPPAHLQFARAGIAAAGSEEGTFEWSCAFGGGRRTPRPWFVAGKNTGRSRRLAERITHSQGVGGSKGRAHSSRLGLHAGGLRTSQRLTPLSTRSCYRYCSACFTCRQIRAELRRLGSMSGFHVSARCTSGRQWIHTRMWLYLCSDRYLTRCVLPSGVRKRVLQHSWHRRSRCDNAGASACARAVRTCDASVQSNEESAIART